MNRPLTLVIIIIAMLSSPLSAQGIDKLIQKQGQRLLKNKEFKALSIGIYKDGKTYTHHFGELENGNPPNNETIYEIASVTKTFTGYLVAKAVLEGKLKLDDNVQSYLEGDFSNLAFEGKPITIKDVITHTAGLPHFMNSKMAETFASMQPNVPFIYLELEKGMTKELFFDYLAAYQLPTAPGTKYSYSNAGAELMGYILTSIYKKTIDEMLQDAFLEKLGMEDTAIRLDEAKNERLAQGYWLNNTEKSPNQLNPLWASGSGLKSTMTDLMKYIEFNLTADNPIIEESQTILYEKKTRWMSYFWNAWKDRNGTSFNHHGGTSGMQNWIFLFPKHDLGISIVVNHSDAKAPAKLRKSVTQMLKDIVK